MVHVGRSVWAGGLVYLLAVSGVSFLALKLSALVASQALVVTQPYMDGGSPKLSRVEQRRFEATIALPPLPKQESGIAAGEIPALPASILATRLDLAEREDVTDPTHVTSSADAPEPSSQPSSLSVRVYGYRTTKPRMPSDRRYTAVTARDIFNREFGVLSVAEN